MEPVIEELPSILKPSRVRKRSADKPKEEVKVKVVKEKPVRSAEQIQKDKERMEAVRLCRKSKLPKVPQD